MTDLALELARAVDKLRGGGNEPNWLPLEALLPVEECAGFMFMAAQEVRIYNAGTIRRDATGAPIFDAGMPTRFMFLYKHGITRHYLNIGDDLGCYVYCPEFCEVGNPIYKQVRIEEAIRHAFRGLDQLGATRTTKYDADFIAARNTRLRAAGFTVVS